MYTQLCAPVFLSAVVHVSVTVASLSLQSCLPVGASLSDQSCMWSQVHTQVHMHRGISIETEPECWPPGSSEPGTMCVGDSGTVYNVVGYVELYLSVCSGSVCGCESVCDLPIGSL